MEKVITRESCHSFQLFLQELGIRGLCIVSESIFSLDVPAHIVEGYQAQLNSTSPLHRPNQGVQHPTRAGMKHMLFPVSTSLQEYRLLCYMQVCLAPTS